MPSDSSFTATQPQYKLYESLWPENVTFNFNILTDLNNYCHRTKKWLEVPYIQAFFLIQNHPLSVSLACYIKSFYFILSQHSPKSPLALSLPEAIPLDSANHSSPRPSAPPPGPLPRPCLMKASLKPQMNPGNPNPLSPPHTQSHSHLQAPAPLLPLREVAGAEGIVRVTFPFLWPTSLRWNLGSYATDSTAYTKECEYVTRPTTSPVMTLI